MYIWSLIRPNPTTAQQTSKYRERWRKKKKKKKKKSAITMAVLLRRPGSPKSYPAQAYRGSTCRHIYNKRKDECTYQWWSAFTSRNQAIFEWHRPILHNAIFPHNATNNERTTKLFTYCCKKCWVIDDLGIQHHPNWSRVQWWYWQSESVYNKNHWIWALLVYTVCTCAAKFIMFKSESLLLF